MGAIFLISRCALLLRLAQLAAAGSNGSDFSNNLFSDISPLLALFGENFARQFMSESFSWLDHIVFAMAPLGIITAIVGAIRIAGPSWMRAIIGRARENRASAEVELMSSTSHEVCELWNGESVVRTMGRPLVKQVAVLRREMHDEETFGLYTLEAAQRAQMMEWKVYQGPPISRWLKTWKLSAPLVRALFAVGNTLGLRKKKSSWNLWDAERGSDSNAIGTMNDVGEVSGGTPHVGSPMDNAEKGALGPTPPEGSSQLRRKSDLEAAPNVLLNLHHGSNTGDLIFAAISGTFLQLGVVIFSGFVTYSDSFQSKIPGDQLAYGYPLLAIGTALLTAGLIIASFIIEQSTIEAIWRVRSKSNNPAEEDVERDVQVLWLQKQHVVSDQSFDSFVLQAKAHRKKILTSHRSPAFAERIVMDSKSSTPVDPKKVAWLTKRTFKRIARTRTEFVVLVGTLLGLVGFVLQFQGFRGVNWSYRVIHEHEMDWLAEGMASRRVQFWPEDDKGRQSREVTRRNREFHCSQSWTITFAYRGSLDEPEPEDFRRGWSRQGQRAVDIRRRLGTLTKWIGPVSEHAAAAAAAIKKVMETFFDKNDKFVWILDMPLGGSIYQIRITVDRGSSKEGNADDINGLKGKNDWKDLSAKIESVLSLWLFDIKNKADDTGGDQWRKLEAGIRKRSRYILGPSTNNCLKLDVAWWISNDITPQERVENYEEIMLSNMETVIGYRDVRTPGEESLNTIPTKDKSITTLSIQCTAKLELLLAQHMFSGFMWSAADHISCEDLARPITFDTKDTFNVYDQTTWDSCRLENPKLNALIRDVQRTGIGTLEEASLFIIPPLSCFSRLPSESIVELIRQRVRDNETSGHWEESIQVYSELIKFVKGGVTDRLLYKAIAAVIEFLLIAPQSDIPSRMVESLNGIKKNLMDDTNRGHGQSLRDVTVDLRKIYAWQTRTEEYDGLFEGLLNDDAVDEQLSRKEESRLTRLFGYSTCHVALIQKHDSLGSENWHSYVFLGDILGWTPLHYAALCNPDFYGTHAKLLNVSAREDPRDIAERTPLHYAARSGGWHLGQSLRKHSDLNARGRDGMLPLHWAAKCGNLVMVKMLLDNGSKVNMPDNYQKTPLCLAVEEGHKSAVQSLLEAKADVGARLQNGDTVLHRASQLGHTRIVQALLESGANVNDKGKEGKTALHFACEGGHIEIVRMLLEKNVKPSEYDDSTTTPLHIVASNGHPDIAILLIDHGAEINARNATDNTPLLSTAWGRKPSVMQVLLERGADIMPVSRDGYHPILLSSSNPGMMEILLRYSKGIPELEEFKRTALRWAEDEEVEPVVEMLRQDLNLSRNDSGRTPLHKAAEAGDVTRMHTLFESGADINAACMKGNTPLILASWRGRDAAVSFLLDRGADASHKNNTGHSALHKAAVHGRTGVVCQLLDHHTGIDVDTRTEDHASETALILASWCGFRDTVQLLLDRGADPLAVNANNGNNSMHVAASRGFTKTILLLLDRGADMRQENKNGWTALDWAAHNGDEPLVLAILAHPRNNGWQHSASVKTGKTPLHIATGQGRPGTVILLLDAGADVNAMTGKGDTPLHFAAKMGFVEVAGCLLERGARTDSVNGEGRTAMQVAEKHGQKAMLEFFSML